MWNYVDLQNEDESEFGLLSEKKVVEQWQWE